MRGEIQTRTMIASSNVAGERALSHIALADLMHNSKTEACRWPGQYSHAV